MFELLLAAATLFVAFPATLFAAFRMIKFVPPGGFYLLYSPVGDVRKLGPGVHLLPHPFFSRLTSPFRGLGLHDAPAPGTRVVIDPPPVRCQSADSVPAVVDVAAEGVVLDWELAKLVKAKTLSYEALAATRINQCVSRLLGALDAKELTYVRAMSCLNAPDALADINAELKDCSLKVVRVSIDANGVQLSKTFADNLNSNNSQQQQLMAERDVEERQLEVEAARHAKELARETAEAARLQIKAAAAASRAEAQANSELCVAKIRRETELQRIGSEKERVGALVASGLEARDVANLLVVEASASMLRDSKAEKIVAVPPGLLGLHGLGTVGAGGDSFVAVR